MNIRTAPYEEQGSDPFVVTDRAECPLDNHTAPVVATHDIDGYAHSDDKRGTLARAP
jgi:hypothetical protein